MDTPSSGRGWTLARERSGRIDAAQAFGAGSPQARGAAPGRDVADAQAARRERPPAGAAGVAAVGSGEAHSAARGADPFAPLVERPRPARGRFTLLDLAPISRQRANDCRFMKRRFFCGARTPAGASWCDAHAAVVFAASAA